MPKSGAAVMPVSEGGRELSSYLTQCRLGRGLPSYQRVSSGILIHPAFWPHTDVTGRQDIGPIAYGEPLLVSCNGRPKTTSKLSAVADETARRAASQQIKRAANKGGRSV